MDSKSLLDNYYRFIKENTKMTALLDSDYYEITTPLLDNFNDEIIVYVKQLGDKILITDDHYIMNNLESSGMTLSKSRMKIIESICATSMGVKLKEKEIIVEATKQNFGLKLNSLLQTIIKIDDMCFTSRQRTASYFVDDVFEYLDSKGIFYSKKPSFIGQSGLIHNYDFSIQRTKTKNERFVRIINNASRTNFIDTAFSWDDIMLTREDNTSLFVIINDDNKIEAGIIEAFTNKNISPILWSHINESLEKLAN